jgi:hypothetical protein
MSFGQTGTKIIFQQKKNNVNLQHVLKKSIHEWNKLFFMFFYEKEWYEPNLWLIMCTITLNIYAKQLWFLAYVVNIEQFPSDLDVNDPP